MGKKISLIDYDKIYNEENLITNEKSINNSNEFLDDGIYSERIFGSFNESDNDKDIGTIGWINFDPYYVINPALFELVRKCIPKVNNIINFNIPIDHSGEKVQEPINEEDENRDPNFDIGLIEFKERFWNLMEEYTNKNKYQKEFDFLAKHNDLIFINKFPVYSSKLRPATMRGNTLIFDEINNDYNFLILYSKEIKDKVIENKENIDLLKLSLLYQIQSYTNIVHKKIIDQLKGKKGLIRRDIYGSRLDFSARNVITPLTTYQIDEVAMPYRTFGELYKFQIINLISKVKGINYNQATTEWEKGMLGYNEEFYNFMMELVKKTKNGLRFLLNRNPTISLGSILYVKVAVVKKDYKDLTLGISNNLLSAFSGDFDGDVLNIIGVMDPKAHKHFKKLSPESFIVNRDDGEFNSDFDLVKDQQLGIHILNN
ncbi:RNA-polymerase beta-subunit RpoC [Bacillus phage vB_BpuM-BpSp]|nr:RNA-polymerase beta-subunit RpoC [Bacillus phage vB_BpuM-BpSp]